MKIEAECHKITYEATAYGIKYKSYGDSEETIFVHISKKKTKSMDVPDSVRITIEWLDSATGHP